MNVVGGMVDICDTVAEGEEMFLWSVKEGRCCVLLRTDTIMATELAAVTQFRIYHKITNKISRELQYINYTYIEFRFSSKFLLIIILSTEQLIVKAKFVYVVS